MPKSPRSLVPFFDARSRRPVDALNQAVILRSSKEFRWNGVQVELASHEGWVVDDVHVDAHYLAVNLDTQPLVIERKTETGYRREICPPGALVIHPVGESFSFRVAQPARWGGVLLAPNLVASTLGSTLHLPGAFGVDDPQLLHIVSALVEETLQEGPTGALYAEHLGAALAVRLAVRHRSDKDLRRVKPRGGIALHRLRRIEEYIDAHLDRSLSLHELAALAELSLYHFAREFKTTTGSTPHEFVLHRRLERAKNLLIQSKHSVREISMRCGFSDASHLVRAFRIRFGLTPGRWRSQSGRSRRHD